MSTSGRKYITSVLLRTTIENEWGKLRKLSLTVTWNRHLIVVERFACPCEPESCVVWSLVLLVGSLMAEWSQVRGQTKNGSKNSNE